ncbi:PAAR domain-containing protein [Pseudomonas mandelii]|jgi:uncharacterized Zn-binding protein involved in type VI secretion|uniref:Zn-binding Pro-Ala-Ala-Arg (PAAR) domain-containing protein, incolved in TypeVI secretion n=1 Tax=Pseudomonas mandelii TaxID=75612 RepID=A0ABY0VJB1_9PSED|nr:PAAR domain-containing protein [Pseudomonas mandelii]TWS10359.1 hypothetical protein FJD35_11215 [Pseudomonas mandelii]SDU32206.1 Zn-binding Pro-Ala-Ala-Arg (PAAR) domain-containing protein, incolved in TypeVI secretion [Pseudomonas mandelii]
MSGKPAARVTDPTACPLPGHGTNPIAAGSGDVFFDGLAAARQGDASACGGAMSGGLATTVLINGKPAVTVDSVGTHGNKVTAGSGTVIIGNSHSPVPFVAPLPLILPGFDEQFVLTDKSGAPMANRRYLLVRENGLQEEGVTSDTGLTHRVTRHASAEKVDIYVASED